MAKICPITKEPVLYLTCQECEVKTNCKDFDIANVKVGDHIICCDEYSHDYVEHELVINSIERDKEEGIILYGDDLTYPEDEYDDYITRVNSANFIKIVRN